MTKDQEIALLRAQLKRCTTAMRVVAAGLRDCVGGKGNDDKLTFAAELLEIARAKPMTPEEMLVLLAPDSLFDWQPAKK